MHKNNKQRWLISLIDNYNLYGIKNKDRIFLKKKYRHMDLMYLNSNEYQVRRLFNKLGKYSKKNKSIYQIYQYNVDDQSEEYEDINMKLFNKQMYNSFIDFCYKESI
jgi:hypothetical protein